jgi:hypothetical protein
MFYVLAGMKGSDYPLHGGPRAQNKRDRFRDLFMCSGGSEGFGLSPPRGPEGSKQKRPLSRSLLCSGGSDGYRTRDLGLDRAAC